MSNKLICYVHIPKAAGTSLTFFLSSKFKPDEVINVNGLVLFPSVYSDLSNLNEVSTPIHMIKLVDINSDILNKSKFIAGHIYGNSFINETKGNIDYITMLRNPISQFISFYNHIIMNIPGHFAYKKAHSMSFKEFLMDDEVKIWFKDIQTQYITKDLDVDLYKQFENDCKKLVDFGIRKQIKHSQISDEELFNKAKKRLDKYLFVGITERFKESTYLLSYYLDIEPTLGQPFLNINQNKHVEECNLSKEEIELIKKITPVDHMIYEYYKGEFEKKFNFMIESLLLKNHGVLARNPSIKFQFPVCGNGWHGLEAVDNFKFNWTGPETISAISIGRISICNYKLRINILYYMAPDILESLKIYVNNYKIEFSLSQQEDMQGIQINGYIEKEVLENSNGDITFEFHVNRTMIVEGCNFERKLGIAFSTLELDPEV